MNDFQAVLALLPERARTSILAAVSALLALQVLASVLVQALPSSAMRDPRWGGTVRTLHRFGHMRFSDELGTLKLPGAPLEQDPRETTIAAQRARIAQLEARLGDNSRATVAPPVPTDRKDQP